MSKLLKDHLRKSAESHKVLAESAADGASHAHALARLHGGEVADHFRGLGKALENHARAAAEHSSDCLEACDKATDSDDLTKAVPDGLRSVISPAPFGSAVPPGLTPVARLGQPPLSTRPDIPLGFEKILGSLEDEERPL